MGREENGVFQKDFVIANPNTFLSARASKRKRGGHGVLLGAAEYLVDFLLAIACPVRIPGCHYRNVKIDCTYTKSLQQCGTDRW